MLSILSLFTACSGQTPPAKVSQSALHDARPSIGDTVQELGNHLMVIFQDTKNTYWFGSWGEGVYRYDGNIIVHYTTEDGLAHNRIDEFREDKLGNIYFNTPGGISKFDGQRFTTLTLTKNSSTEWKLESDDLWFKGYQDSAVVYRYDGTTLHRLAFPETEIGADVIARHPRTVFTNLKYGPCDVYTIYKDTRGNVWFGTGAIGVCRYDGNSHDWISEIDVTELHDGPANGVRGIIEDNDGYFWFSNALYRYKVYPNTSPKHAGNRDEGKENTDAMVYKRETGIDVLDGNSAGIDLEGYMSVVKDEQGNLWMVGYMGGAWRFNPSAYFDSQKEKSLEAGDNSIIRYPVTDGDNGITTFSIYKDNHGNLWIGTHENGVYKFNGVAFERFRPGRINDK